MRASARALLLPCALTLLLAACEAYTQGQINAELVTSDAPEVVIEMSRITDQNLRYFDVVEPGSREVLRGNSQLELAGRGGYGAGNPSDETWNVQLLNANDASSQMCVPYTRMHAQSNGLALSLPSLTRAQYHLRSSRRKGVLR